MRRRRSVAADIDFWPGFTDALAGVLLMMVFVLTLFAVTQAGLVHVASGQDAELRAFELQIAELRRLLGASDERASALQRELIDATRLVDELSQGQLAQAEALDAARSDLEAERTSAADLVRQLRDYVLQLQELNAKLANVEQTSEQRRATIADLQLAMNRLRAQLATMSEKVQAVESEAGAKALRLNDLLAEMAKKDQRIAELERLERYTSEFLARMSEVFRDNPNIKVVGDRFVFQSEVLFASGSAEIGPSGRRELDKFVTAIRELIPRIPKDLDVNIQVQGHTDIDPVVLSDRFASNWHLSSSRALEVVRFLAERGIPDAMMSAAGFGEHAPRVPGRSPEAKAQNRRIEIRITRR